MDHSQGYLLTRADGFTETPDGDIAVVMVAKGQPVPSLEPPVRRIRFATCPACPTQEIRWGEEDPLSIFSEETAMSLLRMKLAVNPPTEVVAAFNAKMTAMEKEIDAALEGRNSPAGAASAAKVSKSTKAPESSKGAAPAPTDPEGAAGE